MKDKATIISIGIVVIILGYFAVSAITGNPIDTEIIKQAITQLVE